MAKIVVSEFVTLDGVMEDPGGAEGSPYGGWAFQFERGKEGDRFKYDELMAAEVLLLGRVTYEGFAKAWPSMQDKGGFADKMNSMSKKVVSTTLKQADWNNSTVVKDEVVAALASLKEQPGGDVLVAGSATLVKTLAEHGLVDEYRLMVFPIVLGGGKKLFGDGVARTPLRLTSCAQTGDCIALVYNPKREG